MFCVFDCKDEVIFFFVEFDFVFKFGMLEIFFVDGVVYWIFYYGFYFFCVVFIVVVFLCSFCFGYFFKIDNVFGEIFLEFFGVGVDDWVGDGDGWYEVVGGGCDG